MKAIWNETIVAESHETIVVEGNHYFPEDSINKQFFSASNHSSKCPWKGTANYYDLKVEGKTHENAAWQYQEPKTAANNIKGYVAFWKDVNIEA